MVMVMLGHATSPSPFAELSVLLPPQKPAISLNFTLNVATKVTRRLSNPTSGQFATTRTIVSDDSKQNVDIVPKEVIQDGFIMRNNFFTMCMNGTKCAHCLSLPLHQIVVQLKFLPLFSCYCFCLVKFLGECKSYFLYFYTLDFLLYATNSSTLSLTV